jgi:hypothetical protein
VLISKEEQTHGEWGGFVARIDPTRDIGDLDQRKLLNRSTTAAYQIVGAGEAAAVRENGHPKKYADVWNHSKP